MDAGESGGIMTLTSSKGHWSWRQRKHILSNHSRDGSTHGYTQRSPTLVTFDLKEEVLHNRCMVPQRFIVLPQTPNAREVCCFLVGCVRRSEAEESCSYQRDEGESLGGLRCSPRFGVCLSWSVLRTSE